MQPTATRWSVEGDLTLVGKTAPIAFDVAVGDDGTLSGSAVVKQTDWGIKPYSALFGALKVADEVEVAFDATLPAQRLKPAVDVCASRPPSTPGGRAPVPWA